MRKMQQNLLVCSLLFSVGITGCTSDAKVPELGSHLATVSVVAIDRTEGMHMAAPGIQIAERLIRQAKPGDQMTFQWISDISYSRQEVVATLEIPMNTLQKPNQYDIQGKRAYAAAVKSQRREEAQAKLTTIEMLRSQNCLLPTSSTDLIGAMQSAVERLSAADNAVRKEMILTTDLKDNQGYAVALDLRDIHIKIFLLSDELDPSKVQSLKQQATDQFMSLGAKSVEFPYVNIQSSEPWDEVACAR